MIRPSLLAAIAIVIGALSGCGNDDGGPIPDSGMTAYDGGPCTPIPLMFSAAYEQVFSSQTCARPGCHETPTVMGGGASGLDFSAGKDAAWTALVNAAVTDPDSTVTKRVTPNDPTNSMLWRKLTEDDPPGFGSRMPLGCSGRFPQACLNPCQLDVIQMWIEAGAPNN